MILKMIDLKSNEEIEIMKEGGKKLKKVVEELLPLIEVNVTTEEIDKEAEKLIRKYDGYPSFKTVKNYRWSTCLPVNEQVVHTPPSKRKLKSGDILTLDIGMLYKGFHTDFATTIIVGNEDDKEKKYFLSVGEKALYSAIKQARAGEKLGKISAAIEKEIYSAGFRVIKELTGHGIGSNLHEDPYVFGYQYQPIEKTPLIKPGLTLAIEVIYSQSTEKIAYENGNSWSIITSDGSLSACFEHTVAITENETFILT